MHWEHPVAKGPPENCAHDGVELTSVKPKWVGAESAPVMLKLEKPVC